MSVPFSWGPAQQARTAGESWSKAKLGLAVAQGLEFGPENADFKVFFVPGQGKALSSLLHGGARGERSQEGSGGEPSTRAAIHVGSVPAPGGGHQESANKPQPVSFWPQRKSSIAASTQLSQPDPPSPVVSSGCRQLWTLECLIEVVPHLSPGCLKELFSPVLVDSSQSL